MFVGANHSGKSRFLRALAKDFALRIGPESEETKLLYDRVTAFINHWDWLKKRSWPDLFKSTIFDLSQTSQLILKDIERGIPISNDLLAGFREHHTVFDALHESLPPVLKRSREDDLRADAASGAQKAYQSLLDALPAEPLGRMPARFYIPVLRGLRLFSQSNAIDSVPDDHYLQRTQADYFHGNKHVEIFTGYTLYHRIRDMLLGRQDERRRVREYEKFLSENFFENKEVTLTPHRLGVLHVTIAGEEQAIHDVGDGLQSAIILTFEPFVRRDEPCLFFIEEPELFLHPGLQRHILEFFLRHDNHLFFFTTHSNHFLGMSFDYDDISIYNFQRDLSASERDKPRFLVTPVSRGDHSSLALLGVRNSSVFLVNATIWVEGITDRRYVRKFMDLYRRHCVEHSATPDEDISRLEEDIHYAFVEYGGANLRHWSFKPSGDEVSGQEQESEAPIEVQTLCAKAFLIRDDDETSSGDRKKRKKAQNDELEAALGKRFARTPGREIENLLPPRVIEAVLREYVPATRPDAFPLQRDRYRNERLGKFLDELAGVDGKWGDEYGTLKRKNDFCSKAVEHLDKLTFEELAPEVQDMMKQICRFLVQQNRLVIAPRRS